MNVFYCDSMLLYDDYVFIISEDSKDTILVTSEAMSVIGEFFSVYSYMTGSEFTRQKYRVEDHWYTTVSDDFIYDNVRIAAEAWGVYYQDIIPFKGYLLVLFALNADKSALLVVTYDDLRFVGWVSSYLGTVSTIELSQLILSTPEISWNI